MATDGNSNNVFSIDEMKVREAKEYSKVSINLVGINHNPLYNIIRLQRLLSLPDLKEVYFYGYDYDVMKYISFFFDQTKCHKRFILIDDCSIQDRSYIGPLPNSDLYIPVRYQMLGLDLLGEKKGCHFYAAKLPTIMQHGIDECIQTPPFLQQVMQLTNELLTANPNINDLEKMLIILNYFEARFQYVGGIKSFSSFHNAEYIASTYDRNVHGDIRDVSTLFDRGLGACYTMALGYLYLNSNSIANINCGLVMADGHLYNWVSHNKEFYATDSTWSVTRNENQVPDALKASKFSDTYFLLGQDALDELDHHKPIISLDFHFAKKSFDRSQIEEARQHLESLGVSFEYGNKVNIPSYCHKLKK